MRGRHNLHRSVCVAPAPAPGPRGHAAPCTNLADAGSSVPQQSILRSRKAGEVLSVYTPRRGAATRPRRAILQSTPTGEDRANALDERGHRHGQVGCTDTAARGALAGARIGISFDRAYRGPGGFRRDHECHAGHSWPAVTALLRPERASLTPRAMAILCALSTATAGRRPPAGRAIRTVTATRSAISTRARRGACVVAAGRESRRRGRHGKHGMRADVGRGTPAWWQAPVWCVCRCAQTSPVSRVFRTRGGPGHWVRPVEGSGRSTRSGGFGRARSTQWVRRATTMPHAARPDGGVCGFRPS